MVACLHDPAWISLCEHEFEKSLSLGRAASFTMRLFITTQRPIVSPRSMVIDAQPPWLPAIWLLGQTFQEFLRQRNRSDFLLSAEAPFDLQHQHYALSYFRIFDGHIPAERYADPFYPIMIAVTGFDDREMINRALLYRYIISYEPYNFKGDLDDFPLTVDYGKKVDAFRSHYADYLWKGEFRDSVGAQITIRSRGSDCLQCLFACDREVRAMVLINDDPKVAHEATLELQEGGSFRCASPESPELKPCGPRVVVPARSALVVFEGISEIPS